MDAEGSVDARGKPTIPSNKKFAVTLCISEFEENPETGIASILANHEYVGELHLVQYAHDPAYQPYEDFKKDLDELEGVGVKVVRHAILDPTKITKKVLVEVQPDMQMCRGALQQLYTEMEEACEKDSASWAHFAVTSVLSLRLSEKEKRKPIRWLETLSYGFLLVIMMMDFFRSSFNFGKYHKTTDLRARLVYHAWPKRVQLAREPWIIGWIRNTYRYPARWGREGLMLFPEGRNMGVQYVLKTIKQHNQLGIGMWILGFLIYYWMFALPWWNPLFRNTMLEPFFVRATYSSVVVWMSYLIHLIFLGVVANTHIEVPLGLLPLMVVFYPVYLTLSPIILVYGRFHVAKASWVKRRKKKK